jgi:hypothetical protein
MSLFDRREFVFLSSGAGLGNLLVPGLTEAQDEMFD